MDTKSKALGSKEDSTSKAIAAAGAETEKASSDGRNPYFRNANCAASEILALAKDGVPTSAARTEDRLRLMALKDHCNNEIQTLADGFSAIGTLVSIGGQVADDVGISGIMLMRLGGLVEHMAATLDAVNELRSDAAFTLSQAARGAA